MSSNLRLALSLTAGAAALAACTPADHALGEAVKYDMAIQTIDPDPVYDEDDAQPGYHGEKGAEAVKRYRTDAVKQIEQQTTTSGGQGGGSGGGTGPQ